MTEMSFIPTCPTCGALVTGAERRPGGDLICERSHRIKRGTEVMTLTPMIDLQNTQPLRSATAPVKPWTNDPDGWTEETYRAFWDVVIEDVDGMEALDPTPKIEPVRINSLDASGLVNLIDMLDMDAFKDPNLSAMILGQIERLARAQRGPRSEADEVVNEYGKMIEQASLNWQPGLPPVHHQLPQIAQAVTGKRADVVVLDDPLANANEQAMRKQLEAQRQRSVAMRDMQAEFARQDAAIEVTPRGGLAGLFGKKAPARLGEVELAKKMQRELLNKGRGVK